MLHLVTPLYRFHNVEQIYNSIINYEDVIWHVGKSEDKEYEFPHRDDRVKIYNVPCRDIDAVAKRNFALANVTEGYFHLLDDDTTLHPNMYKLYKEMNELNYKGMVIGKQILKSGVLRLREVQRPIYCQIDAGNVLCHHSAINHILNAPDKSMHLAPDYNLWEKAYNFFKECKMTPDVISVYNLLR